MPTLETYAQKCMPFSFFGYDASRGLLVFIACQWDCIDKI